MKTGVRFDIGRAGLLLDEEAHNMWSEDGQWFHEACHCPPSPPPAIVIENYGTLSPRRVGVCRTWNRSIASIKLTIQSSGSPHLFETKLPIYTPTTWLEIRFVLLILLHYVELKRTLSWLNHRSFSFHKKDFYVSCPWNFKRKLLSC